MTVACFEIYKLYIYLYIKVHVLSINYSHQAAYKKTMEIMTVACFEIYKLYIYRVILSLEVPNYSL